MRSSGNRLIPSTARCRSIAEISEDAHAQYQLGQCTQSHQFDLPDQQRKRDGLLLGSRNREWTVEGIDRKTGKKR
jgi:hypothetical protein